MSPLEQLRHSTAHVLGAAVLRLYPNAQLDIGPPTAQGFYYDFGGPQRFSTGDFEKIEAEMRTIIAEDQPFIRSEVTREKAASLFTGKQQTYKVGRLADIPEGEAISLYQNGNFIDLCAGMHLPSTGKIGAFKLLSIAGSYHRGDVTQPQLQRIYGTAFLTQEELDAHLERLDQASLRDHRKIGQQLKLFALGQEIGSGLPLLLPKGAVIRQQLEKLISDKLYDYGYESLYSPHIGSIDLYKTSGHYPYYADSMYEPIKIDDREFLLKPMNCPMHIQAYTFEPRSYRDLPQRYAEFGTVYRMEQSGELNGLTRVRGFTQDDGHIFCTAAQLKDEFKSCLQLVQEVMAVFDLKTECRVSLRNPANKSKYAGADDLWDPADACIREVVEELELTHTVGLGEAAFYGPKLDFMALDAIGRSWQLGTIQVDFSLPDRFQLEYTGSDNKPHRPVMIHRAVFGSIERFMGLLIEHYAGDFPLWLAPEQIRILSITPQQQEAADALHARCKKLRLRTSIDTSRDPIGAKIRRCQLEKIPVMLILGKREIADNLVAVRSRQNGDEGTMSPDEFFVSRPWSVDSQNLSPEPLSIASAVRKKSSAGFTLVELLVVISIIATLAALATLGARSMMLSSKQAACASNLRNIGLALHLYAQDHDGKFPETTHTADLETAWIYSLKDYLGDFEKTRICPADPKGPERMKAKGTSYVLNSYLFVPEIGPFGDPVGPQLNRLQSIPEPSRTMMAFTCSDGTGTGAGNDHTHSNQWTSWAAVCRDISPDRFGGNAEDHGNGRTNYLYVDGRVESIRAADLKQKIESGVNVAKPPGIEGLP